MNIAIVGILSNPSVSLRSHNAGNTYYVKSYIQYAYPEAQVSIMTEKDDWSKADILFITEGVNFREGVYNLFGGVSDELKHRLFMLMNFEGRIFSFGREKVYYWPLIVKRNIPGFERYSDLEIDEKIHRVLGIDSFTDSLVLGDSHSLSVYSEGMDLDRNDGKTLHGFLKDGLRSYVGENYKMLRFYAGNIDVRHHICRMYREHERRAVIRTMVRDLGDQLEALNLERIQVVELLPIENEERKLPKTGYFDGRPFWGSWEERNAVKDLFNAEILDMCLERGFEYLSWNGLTNIFGELDFSKMEGSSSVHLAPHFYMFKETFIDA